MINISIYFIIYIYLWTGVLSDSVYKAYVINLPFRTERLKSISDQLVKNGIPFQVFKAITPEDIDNEVILRDLNMRSNTFDAKTELDFKHLDSSTLRKTEIGCAQSHIQIWLEIEKSKTSEPVLILEDDANLVPNFYEKTVEILKKLTGPWDILHVGYCFEGSNMCDPDAERSTSFCKKTQNYCLTCMHAYFINGSPAASKLLKNFNAPKPEILDLNLQKATLNYYVSKPKLALQFPFPSDNGNRIDHWQYGGTA